MGSPIFKYETIGLLVCIHELELLGGPSSHSRKAKISVLREGFHKKRGKYGLFKILFCHTRGWGVAEGNEKTIILIWGLKNPR